MPGRSEQKKRDTKKAAASCQKLDIFFKVKKSKLEENDHVTDGNMESTSSLTGTSFVSSDQVDIKSDKNQLIEVSDDNSTHDDDVYCSLQEMNEMSDDLKSDKLPFNDIGLLINETMTNSEIQKAVSALNDTEKYNLLKKHIIPDSTYKFPLTLISSKNRKFQLSYLQKFQ